MRRGFENDVMTPPRQSIYGQHEGKLYLDRQKKYVLVAF